jgi:hypothetical protein
MNPELIQLSISNQSRLRALFEKSKDVSFLQDVIQEMTVWVDDVRAYKPELLYDLGKLLYVSFFFHVESITSIYIMLSNVSPHETIENRF